MIWSLSLSLRSPFVIGGEETADSRIDARTLMDEGGRAILPGTAVKGLLRDALKSLTEAGYSGPSADDLFGVPSPAGSSDTPHRANLHFGDLIAAQSYEATVISRIRIDGISQTVAEGALFMAELAAPPGTVVTLTGLIHFHGMDDQAELVRQAICDACTCLDSIGQWRHIGFGQVVDWALNDCESLPSGAPIIGGEEEFDTTDSDVYALVEFTGPFLVAANKLDSNAFSGSVIIPGGVLKGALADEIGSDVSISNALSSLTFNHGFPVHFDESRSAELVPPRVFPRSLAFVKIAEKQLLTDLMRVPRDHELAGQNGAIAAISFRPDWKEAEENFARSAIGGNAPNPARQRRTRAQIDEKTGNAVDRMLFSQEAVCPWTDESIPRPLVWAFRVSGSDTDLQLLCERLGRRAFTIGKLKTIAHIAGWQLIPLPQWPCQEADNRITAVITLTSDALISPFAKILKFDGNIADVYAAYFGQFGCDIQIDNFFASQRFVTGYQAVRFPVDTKHYCPWVVTEAGSTFLLSAPSDGVSKFKELLAEWSRFGLAPDYESRGNPAWQEVPFPRENGYGAVIVSRPKPFAAPAGWSLIDLTTAGGMGT